MPILILKNKKTGERLYMPSKMTKIIYKNYIDKTTLYINREQLIEILKREGTPLPFEEEPFKEGKDD